MPNLSTLHVLQELTIVYSIEGISLLQMASPAKPPCLSQSNRLFKFHRMTACSDAKNNPNSPPVLTHVWMQFCSRPIQPDSMFCWFFKNDNIRRHGFQQSNRDKGLSNQTRFFNQTIHSCLAEIGFYVDTLHQIDSLKMAQ